MAVAERGVQAHICQLATSYVLLFGSHRGEDDTRAGQAQILSVLLDVGLTHRWKSQEPQHTVGHALQDLHNREQWMELATKSKWFHAHLVCFCHDN